LENIWDRNRTSHKEKFELTVNSVSELFGPEPVAMNPPEAIDVGRAVTHSRIIDLFSLSGKIIGNGAAQPSRGGGSGIGNQILKDRIFHGMIAKRCRIVSW
jgi:hypothetical protein